MERPSNTEAMLSSIPAMTLPAHSTRRDILCPQWKSIVFAIEPDGLSVKCKSCKQVHHYSKDMVIQLWDELAGDGRIRENTEVSNE